MRLRDRFTNTGKPLTTVTDTDTETSVQERRDYMSALYANPECGTPGQAISGDDATIPGSPVQDYEGRHRAATADTDTAGQCVPFEPATHDDDPWGQPYQWLPHTEDDGSGCAAIIANLAKNSAGTLNPAPAPTAPTILEDATATLTQRTNIHGDPERALDTIAKLWSAWLDHELAAGDVAAMMALLKIGRAAHNPLHRDNWVDGAAYMALAAEATGA